MVLSGQALLRIKILIAVLLLMALMFSGCAGREIEEPGVKVPVKKAEVKELSLNEVLQETSTVLTTTWTPYSLDDVLAFLSAKKPKAIEDEKKETGGPVSVKIIYPERYSLIDREINFVASAFSESGKIDSVTFYLDGVEVAKLSSPPYAFSFNPEAHSKSEHNLKVVAKSGNYKDQDSIKFYNVVKGSFVIYPWRPTSGNIPYSYVNSYYPPENASVEVAMFSSYTSSTTFYVDFKRKIDTDLNILLARVDFKAVDAAYQNQDPVELRFYNYGLKNFDRNPLYILPVGQEPQTFPEKDYERYSFDPYKITGEWVNDKVSNEFIPFYGINPFTKEIWLRILGKGPRKFYVKPIVVEFYGIKDNTPPRPKYRSVFSNGQKVVCEFYASEPLFATIYAYDASGQVRSYSEPKPEGWVEIEIADNNTSFVSLKVTDGAGHTVTLPKKRVRR